MRVQIGLLRRSVLLDVKRLTPSHGKREIGGKRLPRKKGRKRKALLARLRDEPIRIGKLPSDGVQQLAFRACRRVVLSFV